MARIKSAEKALRWREILKRQTESEVSIRRFCAMERISEPSFYAWRKKLLESMIDDRRGAMGSRQKKSDEGPLFVPVKLVDTASMLEIIHPLGYRIQVAGEVNPVALRHVIEALDERAGR